ncbi:hypothetical protein BAE44_0022207 [Dichanthelium oligosanthes]|uniref:F-box/kelch-repeat protein n=1 Tax=Dichanthelium oligosanthes TaxID=888268 RepID=A0A1E5UVD9_9POAL|nr:hypothetical protein BAE44_0022207 [Dichanthelium oligosanthes]
MPAPRWSFFPCAAVGGRVFVAGGHDDEKNTLWCAATYNAEADAWAALPDMAREHDEARGIHAGTAFVALGGYPTEAQRQFAGSAEAFDPATWSLGPVRERVIEDGVCPRTCCSAPGAESETMYMLHDGHVMVGDTTDESGAWRTVARMP